jgi:hypothetical protein
MPNMANITVKKNDGTTDVVYTALAPSAGDKTPAYWRNSTVGVAENQKPEVRMVSKPNGDLSARTVTTSFTYPSVVTGSDGKISVAYRMNGTLSFSVPQGMPTADVNEAASQFLNVCASQLVKDCYKAGFSPT